MESVVIDWLLVCIATIVNLCMKSVWFSRWMFGTFSSQDCSCKISRLYFFVKFCIDFLLSFVIAYAFALLQSLLVITSITDAMILSWIVWLAFTIPSLIDCWLNRQQKGASIFSQVVFKFISLSVVSAIIGA